MERKIIEIYADEKKDEGIITFDFRKVDDTEVSNALMKKLLIELSDEYEVEKVVEKMDIEELKKLFYSDNLTQAGKRELINYYEKRIAELEEERELVGLPVRNKRSGTIGIVLHQWKNGSIAVLEKINPRVINTHDSWNTLEIITDKVNQNKVKEETKKWKLKRI